MASEDLEYTSIVIWTTFIVIFATFKAWQYLVSIPFRCMQANL